MLEPSIELGTAKRSTIDVCSPRVSSRFRLHRIGYWDQDRLHQPVPRICQPKAIGIVQILQVNQELESSVYSKKRFTFSLYLLL